MKSNKSYNSKNNCSFLYAKATNFYYITILQQHNRAIKQNMSPIEMTVLGLPKRLLLSLLLFLLLQGYVEIVIGEVVVGSRTLGA